MDIDVGSIIFSHHHLFSLEHYLANKLVEKYNIYQTAKLQQASASLDKRLAILYRAVDELQAKKMSHKSDEEKEFQVRQYLQQHFSPKTFAILQNSQ